MDESVANDLRIEKLYRIGNFDSRKKYPRPILIQFTDNDGDNGAGRHFLKSLTDNEIIMCW